MAGAGHERHFERAPSTSDLPLTPDVSLHRNELPVRTNGELTRCGRDNAIQSPHRQARATYLEY